MKRIALIALLMLPAASFATPIRWTLDGTTLQPGTATGSFVFDADTGSYSDISLITDGIYWDGHEFTAFAGDSSFGLIFFQTGASSAAPTIALELNGISQSMLTNAGGVLVVNPESGVAHFAQFFCGGGDSCEAGYGIASINWHPLALSTLTGRPMSSVDEPGTLGLLAAGGLLALVSRRRNRLAASAS